MINSLFSSLPLWICVFWLFNSLFSFKSNSLAKNFLIFFFFIATINYFSHFLYFNRQYNSYCFAENIWIFTSLSLFPIYYYYIRLLTKDSKISISWIWLLIPSFILSIFSFILFFLMDSYDKYIYVHNILYWNGANSDYSFIIKLQLIKQIIWVPIKEAIYLYETMQDELVGRLVKQRELPVLREALLLLKEKTEQDSVVQ